MKIGRAAEILDPEHREQYESLEPVNEACRMGMEALQRLEPRPPHQDGDEHLLACRTAGAASTCTTRTGTSSGFAAVRTGYRLGCGEMTAGTLHSGPC